jgi:8-oxo-dGTP diphosphatase
MPRFYPDSPVCAVGAIVFRGESVLLIQRGHPPAKGQWSIPGGVVHLGETLEDAIRREMREETGLTVQPVRVGKVLDRIEMDEQGRIYYHFVIIDFVCEILSGTPCPASDAVAMDYFPLDQLDKLDMTRGTAAVIREVYLQLSS